MVVENVPPTARVMTVNCTLDDPAGTVTLGGTVTGSLADRDTAAPLAGAGAVSVRRPVTGFPPTTVDVLSESDDRTAPAVTVSGGDCVLLPFSVAVIVAEP